VANFGTAETRLRAQYLGVVTLLGKIAARLPKRDEAHYGIDKAIRDANNYLLVTDGDIRFAKSSDGGYAAFPSDSFKNAG
jgi:hypothetical protein